MSGFTAELGSSGVRLSHYDRVARLPKKTQTIDAVISMLVRFEVLRDPKFYIRIEKMEKKPEIQTLITQSLNNQKSVNVEDVDDNPSQTPAERVNASEGFAETAVQTLSSKESLFTEISIMEIDEGQVLIKEKIAAIAKSATVLDFLSKPTRPDSTSSKKEMMSKSK